MPDSNITKRALAAAMKELMDQKPFLHINIGEICERCGMNRKSFYYHFKDKYDLVNWIYYTEFVSTVNSQMFHDGWKLIGAICDYFYQNRSFYVNALEVSGQNSFRNYFRDLLNPIVQGYLAEIFSDDENAVFFSVFFADAFLVAIERWLTKNPDLSAGDFVKLLNKSITGVAKRIVEDIENDPRS